MRPLFFGLLVLSFVLEAAALLVARNDNFGAEEWTLLGSLSLLFIVVIILIWRGKIFSKGTFEFRHKEGTPNRYGTGLENPRA
jgi:hypothetical protein